MKKVLVADDTKNIRILLSKCLEIENYEVKSATDGREALKMLTEESFDLAFLDKKMPYLSGTEVLKSLRDSGITTPVIIITAYASVKNAIECTKLGAVAYLQKPFTAEKVRNILAEVKEEIEACQNIDQILLKTKEMIENKSFSESYTILKSELPAYPLNAELYLLLSQASAGLNLPEESAKFKSIYDSLNK